MAASERVIMAVNMASLASLGSVAYTAPSTVIIGPCTTPEPVVVEALVEVVVGHPVGGERLVVGGDELALVGPSVVDVEAGGQEVADVAAR